MRITPVLFISWRIHIFTSFTLTDKTDMINLLWTLSTKHQHCTFLKGKPPFFVLVFSVCVCHLFCNAERNVLSQLKKKRSLQMCVLKNTCYYPVWYRPGSTWFISVWALSVICNRISAYLQWDITGVISDLFCRGTIRFFVRVAG